MTRHKERTTRLATAAVRRIETAQGGTPLSRDAIRVVCVLCSHLAAASVGGEVIGPDVDWVRTELNR